MKIFLFKYFHINYFILLILISLISSKNITNNNNNNNKTKAKDKKYISYYLNSTIPTITDNNFDTIIKSFYYNDTDLIILFTVKRCTKCNEIIKSLEEVSNYYKEKKIKFYKLDIVTSGWTSMRFELDYLPNIIYISKGNYSIYPLKNITFNDVKNFIEDENKIFIKIPKKVGYFHLFMKIFKVFSYILSKKFTFWNEDNYIVLIIIFITVFCFVEFLIIKFCCPKRKSQIQDKKHEHKEHKEHKKFKSD